MFHDSAITNEQSCDQWVILGKSIIEIINKWSVENFPSKNYWITYDENISMENLFF